MSSNGMNVANLPMMMKLAKLLIPILLLLNGCANSQHKSEKFIQNACAFESLAAGTAIKLRDKGKTKADLQSDLVPLDKNSSRLMVNMYQFTDEVFEHGWINQMTYSNYRLELCHRQLRQKHYPLTMNPILTMLRQCQQKSTSNDQAINCIHRGLDQYAQSLDTKVDNEPKHAPSH